MHAQPGRFEDRAHERDGRALAVGAGDMDDRRKIAFRMPDRREQPPNAIEREVDQLGMQRQEPRDDGIDGRHCAEYTGITSGVDLTFAIHLAADARRECQIQTPLASHIR